MRRLHEAGSISAADGGTKFRVCLIQEGKGSSASFPREFFTSENADALAGSLSFPGHPEYTWAPENRDPLSAIGLIGESVTIEENDNRMGFWSDYHVTQSRPEVASYLKEFASKLGLSIYIEADGFIDDVTGTFVATGLDGTDPYKSVDLVVAAGAGGKFDRVAEGLRRITEASVIAEEKEVTHMDKDIEAEFAKVNTAIATLVEALNGKAKAEVQAEADTSAVTKAVESRLADYDKAVATITEAKLTESQTKSLRAKALKGEDIAQDVEDAKAVLAEALATAGKADEGKQTIVEHRGGSDSDGSWDATVPGFGKVK